MVMKKLSVLVGVLFLMILFLGVASAADSCSIKLRTSCTGDSYVVMGLSSDENAHGEFPDEETYSHVLCCNFGTGNTTCSPPSHIHPEYDDKVSANKIIGLSSITNAHTEVPNETNYETEVCYGSFPEYLVCINASSCGSDYSMEVLSLSDYTNAHIGGFADTKICCKTIKCREWDVNYCYDYDSKDECKLDPCKKAEASLPDINCDEVGINCFCWWDITEKICGPSYGASDLPRCGNNEIDPSLSEECDGTAMPFTVCSGGNVDLCTGGTVSCYPPGDDNECTLDRSGCTGCVEEGFCGDNTINNLYETCDNNSLSNKTCADFSLLDGDLVCHPQEHAKNCTFDTTGCIPLETHPSKIGKCNYKENTDDNCDDRFLTYNWTATWIWDPENIFEVNPDGGDYITGTDGKWHYDPNEASKKCIGGSNTVPCPAQIQLPFFGSYSIVVILVLIALIYVILTWKKKKFDSKGKVKKK